MLGWLVASLITPRLALVEDGRLRYLVCSQIRGSGRVLSFSGFRSVIFFAKVTYSQKETAEFHAVSLCNMAAIMLLSNRTPIPTVATRSNFWCTFVQRVECCVQVLAIAVVAFRRWLLAGQTQVLSEACAFKCNCFPNENLHQPVWEAPVMPLWPP